MNRFASLRQTPVAACLWAGLLFLFADKALADIPKCLFVSSYHKGYAWSDGVERGLRETLNGKCQIRQFDMDTKRKKTKEDKRAAALTAKQLIESWQPDVVITADDNAAKYLIQPYYRDTVLPFVFCGINWTVDEYGFPYSNVTGMVEVAPVRDMVDEARALVGGASKVLYVGADTATERKNADRIRKVVYPFAPASGVPSDEPPPFHHRAARAILVSQLRRHRSVERLPRTALRTRRLPPVLC